MNRMMLVSLPCALVGLAVWLGPWRDEETKRAGNPVVAEAGSRLKAEPAKTANGEVPGARTRAVESAAVAKGVPPGWAEEMLRELMETPLFSPDLRALKVESHAIKKMAEMISELTTPQLMALLRELEGRELEKGNAKQISIFVATALGRREPEFVLDRFMGLMTQDPHGLNLLLGSIYQSLAKKDPVAAAAWLDRQISAGTMGKLEAYGNVIDTRATFEKELIRELAGVDPVAARARMDALDKEQVRRVGNGDWFTRLPLDRVKPVLEFLRGEADSPPVLAAAASDRLAQGGLDEAAAFMDAGGTLPEERAEMVAESLRRRIVGREELKLSPDDVERWITDQAPDDADRLTGTALGQMVDWLGFEKMADRVMALREESGSDEGLVNFLKTAPESSKNGILRLAESIKDPAARESVTGRF